MIRRFVFLVFFSITSLIYSKEVQLSGTVLNSFHQPIEGVTVGVGGLTATTGTNGSFQLSGNVGVLSRSGQNAFCNPVIHGKTLSFTVAQPSNIIISLYNVNGKIISQDNIGMQRTGTYNYPIRYIAKASQCMIIQLIIGSKTYFFRSVQTGFVFSSSSLANAVSLQSAQSATASLDSLVITRKGFQQTKIALTSLIKNLDTIFLNIEQIPISTYSKDFNAVVPVYVRSLFKSKASPSGGPGGPGPGINFDTVLTWELFKNGTGSSGPGGEPGVIQRVLGNTGGLPFFTTIIDTLINRIKANVNNQNELIDTSKTLFVLSDSIRKAYGVSYLIDFGKIQEDITHLAALRGDLPTGATMLMKGMKIAYTITDSAQYITGNMTIHSQIPQRGAMDLNVFMNGIKKFGQDTLFMLNCQEFETHDDGSFFNSLTEARSLNGKKFQYKWATSKKVYANGSPFDRIIHSIIATGSKDSAFAIRRTVAGFDTTNKTKLTMVADQYFEINKSWNMLAGDKTQPGAGDNSYIPLAYRNFMLIEDMFNPARLPWSAFVIPSTKE